MTTPAPAVAAPPEPSHLDLVTENMREVRRLLEIHKSIAGSGAGHKHHVEVLNKSALVLTAACWESYIEILATNAFDYMVTNSKSHNDFPSVVLHRVSEPLRTAKNPAEVWKLAGSGWQSELKIHRTRILNKYVENFHTPEPARIDALFENLIGLTDCSRKWGWKGIANTQCVSKLETLLTLRHEIAHKVNAHKKISKNDVKEFGNFVFRLSAATSNIVGKHIETHIGTQPWVEMKFISAKSL